MATVTTTHSLEGSADSEGLSLVTSTKTPEHLSQGQIYNPATLAAAVPVWFHPMNDGRYAAILRSHWTAATVGEHGPQSYTASSTSVVPSLVLVDPVTGSTGPVVPLKSEFAGASASARTLFGAASRFGNLYVVGQCDNEAHLQWHRPIRDTLQLAAEEWVPSVSTDDDDVSFHLGCYVQGDFLYVFGGGENDNLYLSRKRWSRVGMDDQTASYTWEYLGPKGWLADLDNLAPLKDSRGNIIGSMGPVSYVHHRDRALMVVTHNISGSRSAIGYVSRDVEIRWRRSPFIAPSLGDGETYLGGAVYLQPTLNANPAGVPDGAYVGFPAVSSVLVLGEDDETSIQTSWTVWPIFR